MQTTATADCAGLAVALWVAYVMRLSDWWPEIWTNEGLAFVYICTFGGCNFIRNYGFLSDSSRGRNMNSSSCKCRVIALLVISYAHLRSRSQRA